MQPNGLPSAEQPVMARAWLVVIVMFVLNMLSTIDRHVIAVLIPEIKTELHLGDFQVSTLHGLAFIFFYTVTGLYFGGLIDRRPRRSIIYFGVTLWSLAATATGLAANYIQMFLARMLIGVGESTISPATQSLLSDLFPPRRLSSAIATLIAAGSVGAGLAFALGGWLLDHLTAHPLLGISPWRQVLLAIGAPGVLLALLVFTFAEPPRRGRREKDAQIGVAEFARIVIEQRRVYVNLLLAFGCGAIVAVTSQSWGPTYARRVLGLSATEVGGVMGLIFGVGGIFAIMGGGFLTDRLLGRGLKDAAIRIYLLALGISAPLDVVAYASGDTTLFYIAVATTHFCMAGAFGPAMASLQMVSDPRSRGRMAALCVLTTSTMSVAVGPMIIGFLTDYVYRAPERLGWSIATVMGVVGCLSAFFLLRARKAFIACLTARMEGQAPGPAIDSAAARPPSGAAAPEAGAI